MSAQSGAYLRVWFNRHDYDKCLYHNQPVLTYAGKSKNDPVAGLIGGPEELTCKCDADLCLVTGLSKTDPPGLHGKMTELDRNRYYLNGTDIVLLLDQ